MPYTGQAKKDDNFLRPRIKGQKEVWPDKVEKWDADAQGVRFRSEILSLTDLWNLYVGGIPDELTEESVARGRKPESEEEGQAEVGRPKKKKKGGYYNVVPIATRSLPGRYNDQGYLHFDQWLYARDQARKELFFLCKDLEFVPDVQKHIHQVVCDQFVQPDFDGVYKEGYSIKDFTDAVKRQNRVPKVWAETKPYQEETLDDFGHYMPDPIEAEKSVNYARTMLLLDPRGFFKTWIDVANVVQLLINAPDARIMLMSGVYKLTVEFLLMIKAKFYLPRGLPPKPFHILFPEFVIRGVDGTSKENFRIKESCDYLGSKLEHDPAGASVGIISIGSSLSGNHCEFLKFDDIVTDDNCNTQETREAIKEKANGAVNLMMEWSWHDVIGTRYFPDDYYGLTIDNFKKSSEDFNLKYFKRSAWTCKPEYESLENSNIYELREDMVVLTWPEHRSYKALRKMLAENETKFRCQQLNQPVWNEENSVSFDRILLEKQRSKVYAEILSQPGYIYGAIDLARENKQFSDFTALAIGKVYQEGSSLMPFDQEGRIIERPDGKWVMVVLEIEFGKWSQTETINRIAKLNHKWKPQSWYGEDIGGLQVFKERIVEISKTTYGHWPYIFWREPENNENAKRTRIKGVELLLRASRMYFLIANWNSEAFEQIEKYKGQRSSRYFKDDVPDVLSLLAKHIPSLITLSKRELEQQAVDKEARYREYLRREMNKVIFGDEGGGFGASQFMPDSGREPRGELVRGPMADLTKKFFGNSGMRA
jgi:hypothetical protein